MSLLLERLATSAGQRSAVETQLYLPDFSAIPTQPARADIVWSLYTLLDQDLLTLRLISQAHREAPKYFASRSRLITRINLQEFEIPAEEISIYSNPQNKGINIFVNLTPRIGPERLKFSFGQAVSIATQLNRRWRIFDNNEMELLCAGLELMNYRKPVGEELQETANMVEAIVYGLAA